MDSVCRDGVWTWNLAVDAPGLWFGRTRANLTFSAPTLPALNPIGDPASEHAWLLVAPRCDVSGEITLPNGRTIPFAGDGYHDHNFGRLPYADTAIWYWGRATFADGRGAGIVYHLEHPDGTTQTTLVRARTGDIPTAIATTGRSGPLHRSPYGLRHAARVTMPGATAEWNLRGGALSEGPFYRRLGFTLRTDADGIGQGIGEVFRPAGLCGPIASRAMWSRIRRRNG